MSQPQLDFEDGVDDEAIVDPEGTYTVGELAEVINRRIRGGEDGLWVRGEIQGWNVRGPHCYFTLADDGAGTPDAKAVIDVAVFAPSRNRLRPMLERHRLRLGDGIKVRIYGYLDFYAPRGQIKLVMTGIDPRFTLGDLAQQRDQVMRRLVAGGLLDANRRTAARAGAGARRRRHQRRLGGVARLPPGAGRQWVRLPALGVRRARAG